LYCSRCGDKLKDNAQFCSKCGEAVSQQNSVKETAVTNEINSVSNPSATSVSPKKKKPGCLAMIIVVIAFIAIIAVINAISSQNTKEGAGSEEKVEVSASELKEQGVKFDEQAWGDFLKLYEAHNDFMKTMESYTNGNISKLDFYDYCKRIEEWFGKASISFKYAKTDDEKTYLSVFEVFALADQAAAKSLIRYLDSNATKDLSKAREEIDRAKQAATTISGNRVVFLRSVGLSKEEVDKKVSEAVAELEKAEPK
jgi:hypothetical protein